MDSTTTGQTDLLDVFFFTNAKFQHLRLAIFNYFHGGMENRWLDTATTDGTRQFAALTDYQFCAWSTRSRTGHRNHCSYGNSLATSTPTLDIGKDITHRNTPLKLTRTHWAWSKSQLLCGAQL